HRYVNVSAAVFARAFQPLVFALAKHRHLQRVVVLQPGRREGTLQAPFFVATARGFGLAPAFKVLRWGGTLRARFPLQVQLFLRGVELVCRGLLIWKEYLLQPGERDEPYVGNHYPDAKKGQHARQRQHHAKSNDAADTEIALLVTFFHMSSAGLRN